LPSQSIDFLNGIYFPAIVGSGLMLPVQFTLTIQASQKNTNRTRMILYVNGTMKILFVWARKSADELIISMAIERDFHPQKSAIAKRSPQMAKPIPNQRPVYFVSASSEVALR